MMKDEGLREVYIEADKQNWTKQELEDYERASIKESWWNWQNRICRKKKVKKIGKAMKEKGYPLEAITELTELTKDEIEKL